MNEWTQRQQRRESETERRLQQTNKAARIDEEEKIKKLEDKVKSLESQLQNKNSDDLTQQLIRQCIQSNQVMCQLLSRPPSGPTQMTENQTPASVAHNTRPAYSILPADIQEQIQREIQLQLQEQARQRVPRISDYKINIETHEPDPSIVESPEISPMNNMGSQPKVLELQSPFKQVDQPEVV